MAKPFELTGQSFARLNVVERVPSKNQRAMWRCVCECGNMIEVSSNQLTSGHTRSCGCLQADTVRRVRTSHGATAGGAMSKEYRTWIQVRRRTTLGGVSAYEKYGACGIGIAGEWVDDFQAFYDHIGPAPSEAHSIDRIDNARGYEPGNVRWATRGEQSRNRRSNIIVEYGGKEMCLWDACQASGISYHTARYWRSKGLPWDNSQ